MPFQSTVLNAMRVPVYKFQRYDIATDKMVVSNRMATDHFIKQWGCAIIPGTETLIDSSLLDPEGRAPLDFATEE